MRQGHKSEDKTDTVLGVRGKKAAVIIHSQTETKGEFLHPVLSDGSAEAVCRSDAYFRPAIVCIGSEPYGYKIGGIVIRILPHFSPALDAGIITCFKRGSKTHIAFESSSIRTAIGCKTCRYKTCSSYQSPSVSHNTFETVFQT